MICNDHEIDIFENEYSRKWLCLNCGQCIHEERSEELSPPWQSEFDIGEPVA